MDSRYLNEGDLDYCVCFLCTNHLAMTLCLHFCSSTLSLLAGHSQTSIWFRLHSFSSTSCLPRCNLYMTPAILSKFCALMYFCHCEYNETPPQAPGTWQMYTWLLIYLPMHLLIVLYYWTKLCIACVIQQWSVF